MIHEERYFECNTGTDGKPVQLFQCKHDVVFGIKRGRGRARGTLSLRGKEAQAQDCYQTLLRDNCNV